MERILCVLIGYICGLFRPLICMEKYTVSISVITEAEMPERPMHCVHWAQKAEQSLLGDCFKCVVAVVLVHLIFGKSHPEMIRLLGMYAAAGTILGHNFPFYLNFKRRKRDCCHSRSAVIV